MRNKTIGVILSFLTPAYRAQIDAAAAKNGYAVRYFDTSTEALENVADCEILYGHPSKKVLQNAKSLKWFHCCWAGVDRLCDEALYPDEACLLSNSSGCYGVTIAEHLVMVCLMLLRRQNEYTALIQSGGWATLPGGIRSLRGSRVTVLGTGDIGTEFARRVRAFAPEKIIGVRRTVRPADAAFDEIRAIDGLDALLPETDILVMCLPGTAETVGLLDARRIALLPRGAYVVNIGRGTAIDQDSLIDALNAGHLGGAALDVTDPEPLPAGHPLRAAKNLLLTPHVAGNTTLGYTCDKNVAQFCAELDRYAAGLPPVHLVDRKKGY